MVQINFARKEISCKIVYYGPGLSGKTTNLEMIHKKTPENIRGQLTSIATEGDRTLFFDFMPMDLGEIAGMKVKLQLYTVPGQVYYNSTRKLVLQGVDGVVFVADSNPEKLEENISSFNNLQDNLKELNFDLKEFPHIIQFNKRDLPNAISTAILNEKLNIYNVPTFEAVAVKGEGTLNTLKTIAKLVIDKLDKKYSKPQEAEKSCPAEMEEKQKEEVAQQTTETPKEKVIQQVHEEPQTAVVQHNIADVVKSEKITVESASDKSYEGRTKPQPQTPEPEKSKELSEAKSPTGGLISTIAEAKTMSPTDSKLVKQEITKSRNKNLLFIAIAVTIIIALVLIFILK